LAFAHSDINIVWSGAGLDEVGVCKQSGRVLVRVDKAFFRPSEVDILLGDSRLIRSRLDWKPLYDFEMLVKDMIENEKV
jgi:GDPmannose 4,6-dehydratase